MSIHEQKTKATFISFAQKQSMVQANVPQIKINSSSIQISTCEKLLGSLYGQLSKLGHSYRENYQKM